MLGRAILSSTACPSAPATPKRAPGPAARRPAAGSGGPPGARPIVVGRWANRRPGSGRPQLDLESRSADRRALSATGSGAGLVRPASTRRGSHASSQPVTMHRRHGVQRSAPGLRPLDSAADCSGGRETQVGAESGTRDNPRRAPKPRFEAVAGKTCGVSLRLVTSTSRRWKVSWPCIKTS